MLLIAPKLALIAAQLQLIPPLKNIMKHFTNFAANIYQTGLQNLISPVVEKETKKYVRKKKEQAEAEKEA
jgi:hypothetical protein